MTYDSRAETLKHISRVGFLLSDCLCRIGQRISLHDHSKLLPPEKEAFDAVTEKLRGLTYGSAEYRESLKELPLDHHYANNSHHPEHYPNGVNGMDLFDLVEMLCDWRAATERHDDGDIRRSLEINTKRFGLSDQLRDILANTIDSMSW